MACGAPLMTVTWNHEGMCVSFQDHETSFPRALSAQRLSPRWCFLDGKYFRISLRGGSRGGGRGGGWGSHGATH